MDFLRPGMTDDDRRAARSHWISACLLRLKPRLFGGGRFAIGEGFTLADIFVAVIYSKGLSLGAERDADYDSHNRLLIDVPGFQVMGT
jgi:maleylacetoacetate isomerase/maleylpyruvate isomerase